MSMGIFYFGREMEKKVDICFCQIYHCLPLTIDSGCPVLCWSLMLTDARVIWIDPELYPWRRTVSQDCFSNLFSAVAFVFLGRL